jgi:hypothetical protein
VADFLMFTEGKNELLSNGMPATCYFLLSTKSVGATSPFTGAETLAGATLGEITGTGYARQSQAEPAPAGGTATFTLMSFATGAATDWPAAVRSVVFVTGAAAVGKAICAYNLIPGGTARDLSAANTTENTTPSLTAT